MFPVSQSTVFVIYPGNQLLYQRLAEGVLDGPSPQAIVGHDDEKRGNFTAGNQPVGSLVRAQPIPLVIIVESAAVKQIQNRIAALILLIVTGRKVKAKLQRLR